MNLDPIDVFGETLGEPIKRMGWYFLGMVAGGWIGEIAMDIDHGGWGLFGWSECSDVFLLPVAILFSSVGPFVVGGLLFFLVSSWRLDWPWFLAVAGASAFVVADGKGGLGWIAWACLNTGVAGAVWMHSSYRRVRWARELSELNAYNTMNHAARNQKARFGETTDGEALPDDPETD